MYLDFLVKVDMPVYLYKCHTCGKEFEYSQRITENALTTCPEDVCECEASKGKGEVERKISKNIGFVFNGKGFYLTDYARKNSSTAHSSTTATASTPTTETKPCSHCDKAKECNVN